MNQSQSISAFELKFTQKYDRGTVIEATITSIIYPSQIILDIEDGFIGRLSVLDLSWCLPEGEAEFKKFKVGDRIQCVVLNIDFPNQQVILSRKHLSTPTSESVAWERIERGEEFYVDVVESFNNTTIVKTKENLYGIINNNLIPNATGKIRVKVNSKLDYSELLSFVPASFDITQDEADEEFSIPEINFIEDDLQSFYSFKNSILGVYATDEQLIVIKAGFEFDDKIFSKEFKTDKTLYIQFELGNASYETTFKQNAIPYFLNETNVSNESENKLLELLSNQHYWFKINIREGNQKTDFSLYNEDVNIFGDVAISKDKKEIKFIIKDFSFGHSQVKASEAKKRNTKYGSFLFSNKLKIISPYGTTPFDNSQNEFLDYAVLKTKCFETVNQLKNEAGEILRQEGRTLAIIDKFLEYQISLIEQQKENNVFVDKCERIPAANQGVAIKLPRTVGDSLEVNEDTVVNVRLKDKDEDKLIKLSDGILSYSNDDYVITFNKQIKLSLLKDGFYLDKRISKKQFQIQREIIQDFLDKKIKIDHIESLLVKPDKVKTPILKSVQFKNENLAITENEDSSNNQITAVKKAVGNQNIFLIQGPPGTGKTTVIAEIIQQLVEKGEKILVSGQNHVAVDNVLEKISQFPKLNLLRVGNPDRIDKQLVRYSIDNLVDEYKIDFKKFIANQLLVANEYLTKKINGTDKSEIKTSLNQYINSLIEKYGVLKEVYKQRHFILLKGLSELSLSEIKETIEILKKWVEESNNEYEILLKPLIYNSIDVVFATCIGIKSDPIFKDKNFKFDTVIIDEAGKANIAESLVAIELGEKVILVGDQKQLPPYMDGSLIDKSEPTSFPNSVYGSEFLEEEILHALKTSFFEFIVNRINADQFPKENIEMLNYQHRMHPNIGEFVSSSFYDGKVKMGSKTHLNRLDFPSPFDKEVVFFDTSNSKNPFEQNDGFSAMNNTEAETISEIILPKLVADRTIGFITSANFTTPSLTFNTESGAYLDEKSSEELDKLFDVIFLQGTTYKQFLGTKKKGKMLVVQSEAGIDSNLLPKSELSALRYTCENLSNNLLDEIVSIINQANEYLYLSTYSIVGLNSIEELFQSIKRAIERSVSVSIFCRGMNYRNDHLEGVSKLSEIGCKVYADVFNHSKGVINEKTGMIFTANIDGNHGLINGFEVGSVLNETQRKEFLDFHKKLIETSFYEFKINPTRNDLFVTYIAYEQQKGLSAPLLPQNPIVSYKSTLNVNLEEFKSSIIFYGKSKDSEYLIIGNYFYKCNLKGSNIFLLEKTAPRFDIEKYIFKFFELKISKS